MAALRQLTPREEAIVNKYSAQHGPVVSPGQAVADVDGGIGAPLLRLPLLLRLEQRGTISRQEAEAGARFHTIFQIAALDALRAADMGRVPAAGGTSAGDLSSSQERCRRRVTEAMTALGGAGSSAASAVWHVVGLEWSVHRWAIATKRPADRCCGILIAGLGVLAGHFAGRRVKTPRTTRGITAA